MRKVCYDANTAAAHIAYSMSEVSAIYPITPSSPMAESCDEWQTQGKLNIFDKQMKIVEMQSEAGAAGAVHGSLVAGALSTTFTASQGLLLMIPNMYKIAGELLPSVFHVAARALSTHALSIFGDHSDVMATRQTGFNMICSASVQESMDLALASHLVTLYSSIPVVHFFDGFRTSHEIQKIDEITLDEIKSVVPWDKIQEFKSRALDPNHPKQMGTAQNPDIYFQNREACNIYYEKAYEHILHAFSDVEKITGRHYSPYEFYGDKDAENVVVVMGSAGETLKDYVDYANSKGEKLGVVQVRVYRPFVASAFSNSIPNSAKRICVLDRTKESGSLYEPLALDAISAMGEQNRNIKVVAGRYGIGGKEFCYKHAKAVFDNLSCDKPKNHFAVGINDDVTNSSLTVDESFDISSNCYEMRFYGLGSDGTVSANKNSIKIIGENTNKFVQGYFEYDSKKSGSVTISHLRVSDTPIRQPFNTTSCDFVACHNYSFIGKFDMLKGLKQNATVLLNTVLDEQGLSENLPRDFVEKLKQTHSRLFVVDATKIADENKLRGKINIIMQTAFFKISNIIPFDEACEKIKDATRKTYGKKGEEVVNANLAAVDQTTALLKEINVKNLKGKEIVENANQDKYYNDFIRPIILKNGDDIPVSKFSPDGSVPTDTSKFEKRGVAENVPCWIKENCIQCGRCVMSCPHACLNAKIFNDADTNIESAPAFGVKDAKYRLQLSPLDCTGCGVCSAVCPAKNKALVMTPINEILEKEKKNLEIFEQIQQIDTIFNKYSTKGLQFHKGYFEFSGACAGCGETPYIRLATALFGDKMVIANATGCSSIYGGSAPTCPYSKDKNGKGPAWASSLFEDNAEFGLGMALAESSDKSIWIVGGDGWAYDIGYGGLDHVLNSGVNVNILVLDTEVYSNTGGQSSKATPRGATAKFASAGKKMAKKNLALIAMANANCYVSQVSLGADMEQTIKAFKEAQAFDGPSIIIAYAPCISHGINMSNSSLEMKNAVASGYWTTFRYNPTLPQPLVIDSPQPTLNFKDFLLSQNRFRALSKTNPDEFDKLLQECESDAKIRRKNIEKFLKTDE